MRPVLVLATAGFVSVVGFAADRPIIAWDRVASETIDHFVALLRFDTSNPPGNETLAVDYLKQVLDREGIPNKTLTSTPGRANLVARLKGNGKKRPILIMGHTDVVGVQREKWTVDPFGGVRKDGYIYGRGATDDKDNVVAGLMLMLLMKRNNIQLDRDVIFLAESGEEGTTSVGIDYMVREHWPEIDAEFALAEGWGGIARNGKIAYMGVATTEKVARTFRLRTRGEAGHGSMPRLDNSIVRLSAALARVGAWETPVRLNETTRAYFKNLASISAPEQAARYLSVFDPKKVVESDRYFARHELEHRSILRTSISPTILKAGFRSNVIPSEAEATLDIRALPGEDMPGFIRELVRVIDDPTVEIIPPSEPSRPSSVPSRMDTLMYKALESVQMRLYPDAVTLPQMMTGGTDMAQLRAKGVQAYGIGPISDEGDRYAHGPHSDDERIEEAALQRFVRLLWEVVLEVAETR